MFASSWKLIFRWKQHYISKSDSFSNVILQFEELTQVIKSQPCSTQISFNGFKPLPIGWGKKVHKDKREIKIQPLNELMASDVARQLEPIKITIKKQGEIVRNMKLNMADESNIILEVQKLKYYKQTLEEETQKLLSVEYFDKARMTDLIKRRFLFDASFSIYGGVNGQYDYGPMGCSIIDNIILEWQNHFVIHERMLKLNCSSITPHATLKASGHVDKFTDYLVKDCKTGDCFRLDHLIKQNFEELLKNNKTSNILKDTINEKLIQLEQMSMEEMNNIVKEYCIKSPSTGNDLSEAMEFNLMFPVSIGPAGIMKGFLRPETAQGIFVNFKKLYEYNQKKLPFACAQIGTSYRNEISPQTGLLRVREFIMAEIEHFCLPDNKKHEKFNQIKDTLVWLYSASSQMKGDPEKIMSIGDAVTKGIVVNEILGYYIARTQQFMVRIGINPKKLRFRQHLNNEMAHYACDCWDVECLTSYGWIECVGIADRGSYDLQQHSKAAGVRLTVESRLSKSQTSNSLRPVIEKDVIAKSFKKGDFKKIIKKLSAMKEDELEKLDETLKSNGVYILDGNFQLTRSMIPSVIRECKEVFVEEVFPSVIEPSFGIGRIFYTLLEHTFRIREDDENRTYFTLPSIIAPVKVSVLPLANKTDFIPFINQLVNEMTSLNIPLKIDDSKDSIGRRYSRSDEISIPFCVTVDFETIQKEPSTVTIRERDSTLQIRMPVKEVPTTIQKLSKGEITYDELRTKWPVFVYQETK